GFHRRRHGARSRPSQRSCGTGLRHRRDSIVSGRIRRIRPMSNRCYIATRKGLFTVDRGNSKWSISNAAFVGDNVTLVMHDPRNGDLLASLNHGHFGIKMHRSRDEGKTWAESTVPQYPPMPEGYEPKMVPFFNKPLEWSLKLVWGLAPGGADEPGVVWCGTMPGGLFKSEDNGDSWELVRSLWD